MISINLSYWVINYMFDDKNNLVFNTDRYSDKNYMFYQPGSYNQRMFWVFIFLNTTSIPPHGRIILP